jgi:hypothetical protein
MLKNKQPIHFCLSCFGPPMDVGAGDESNQENVHRKGKLIPEYTL